MPPDRGQRAGHVWAYDFVEGRTHDGRKFHILTTIDEASREYLALIVARQLRHEDVLAALTEPFVTRGPPAHIRSDNGAEFIANAIRPHSSPGYRPPTPETATPPYPDSGSASLHIRPDTAATG